MSKPRLCAKKPRRMGCAPDNAKHTHVEGEMSFAEFLVAMNRADVEIEKKKEAEALKGVLVWSDILSQR